MAKQNQGGTEQRTRVTCHLPLNSAREEKAFFRVIAYLIELRHQQVGVAGFTHSELRPASFHGYWWPDEAGGPVHDQLVLCTIDFHLASGSSELSAQVKRLKATIENWYRHYQCPQQDVWVVAHAIDRHE